MTKKTDLAEASKLVTDTYWEWHLAFRYGMTPPIEYIPLRKIVERVLGSRATNDEVLVALKSLRAGEVPTIEGLTRTVMDLRSHEETPDFTDLVVSAFEQVCEVRRDHMWRHNSIEELTDIVSTLQRWRTPEHVVYGALMKWAATQPTEAIPGPNQLRSILTYAEASLLRTMKLDHAEIERRAFNWKALTAS